MQGVLVDRRARGVALQDVEDAPQVVVDAVLGQGVLEVRHH